MILAGTVININKASRKRTNVNCFVLAGEKRFGEVNFVLNLVTIFSDQ